MTKAFQGISLIVSRLLPRNCSAWPVFSFPHVMYSIPKCNDWYEHGDHMDHLSALHNIIPSWLEQHIIFIVTPTATRPVIIWRMLKTFFCWRFDLSHYHESSSWTRIMFTAIFKLISHVYVDAIQSRGTFILQLHVFSEDAIMRTSNNASR